MKSAIILLALSASAVMAQNCPAGYTNAEPLSTKLPSGVIVYNACISTATGLLYLPNYSAGLQYTAPYNGAVAQTQAQKLANIVSVSDFGSDPTGATDQASVFATATAAVRYNQCLLIPVGAYLFNSSWTIPQGLCVIGSGTGGLSIGSPNFNTFAVGSVLINNTTSSTLVIIQPTGPNSWITGLEMRDFAVQGNIDVPGATAGDGILFAGGNSTIRNALVQNVLVYNAYGNGWNIQDNTYGSTFIQASAYRNGGNGFAITSTNCTLSVCTGQPSQLTFLGSWADLNLLDGFNVSSPSAADISLIGGSYSDSGVNGIHVASTAINANVKIVTSHAEKNVGSNIRFDGGYNHTVESTTIAGDSTSAYGIYVNDPGSNFFQVAAYIKENTIVGNVTDDIFITSQANNTHLYDQDQLITNYVISDSSATTQYISQAFHAYTKNSYTITASDPCIIWIDTTSAAPTPKKEACSIGGSLSFLNNAGVVKQKMLDNGDISFEDGSGSFTLTGTPTATRTETFPDMSGTVALSLNGGQTATLTASSTAIGVCQTVATGAITGITSSTQTVSITATGDIGSNFTPVAFFNGSGGVTVRVCNTGLITATPNAVAFNVKVQQ